MAKTKSNLDLSPDLSQVFSNSGDLEDLVLGEPRVVDVPSKLSRPFGGLFHLGKRLSPLLEFEEREEVRIKLEPGLEEPSDADSDGLGFILCGSPFDIFT